MPRTRKLESTDCPVCGKYVGRFETESSKRNRGRLYHVDCWLRRPLNLRGKYMPNNLL